MMRLWHEDGYSVIQKGVIDKWLMEMAAGCSSMDFNRRRIRYCARRERGRAVHWDGS